MVVKFALKNLKKYFPLFLIALLFLVTRLYKISDIPPSVYWDEASIGYNAYSISQTLKDEWGNFLPVHFRAFGEFKLPVYIYSVSVLTKIRGLDEVSIRLPAVVFSLGSVFVVYLLVKKLFSESTGILAAFFLVISPWFFMLSRIGYEASAGLFFFLLGTYFFLNINRSKYFVFFTAFSFILSYYSYNTFRLIIPIWIVVLFFLFFPEIKKIRKLIPYIVVSSIIIIFSLIPVYKLYKYDVGALRYQTVAIKNTGEFFNNYFSHFSWDFLIANGDSNPRSQQPGFGQIFVIEIPFLLIGIYSLYKKRKPKFLIPLVMLVLAPIPASLTRESPHALRSILMAPAIAILSSTGIYFLTVLLKKYRLVFMIIIVITSLAFFENYALNFFRNYPKVTSQDWQFGYKAIFSDYKAEIEKAEKVVISDEYGQPYIFALYYLKYGPRDFWTEVIYNDVPDWGHSTVLSFNKFEFKKPKKEDLKKNSLVFSDKKIDTVNSFREIKFLDGKTAFYVYQ